MSLDDWPPDPSNKTDRATDPLKPGLWPFWQRAYALGDPLPELQCRVERPQYSFD